jgi:hypothetical protein
LVTIAQRTATADYANLAGRITLANPAVANYAAQNGGAAKVASVRDPRAAGALYGPLEPGRRRSRCRLDI